MISDAVVAVVAALPYAERVTVAALRHLEKRRSTCDSTTTPEETLPVSSVRLSDLQRFALLALDDRGVSLRGDELAEEMSAVGRETTTAAAHQAGNGLAGKGLAVKGSDAGLIRYEITALGRVIAERLRSTP